MHYPPLVAQNWNGALLNHSFRIVKPQHPDHVAGTVYEMKDHSITGLSLGHAKVIAVATAPLGQLNDTLSFPICNKPAPYLKKVLAKMFALTENHQVHILTMQWTERNLETHRAVLLTHWDSIVKNSPNAAPHFKTVNI